ncbi:hypothetical protein E2562_009189 [Oryza meyeriana var. granulata]|uniref:Uncharacterized protein n=1 Tax=Oryza meyeriana var. granulata TaxID=110450 RepID=A0A6G1CZW9_9ORYZ|nr:hypothetical protein E2562_009189 [Oryza meyeriana var. granulata]
MSLSRSWDLVEELQVATLAGWVELDEMHSALAKEEVHLQEGSQQQESVVRATKVVYDRNVAEVERERSALDMGCAEAVAAREEAMTALRELEGQQEALTILKMQAEEHKLELARREVAATELVEAATQHEGILRSSEARERSKQLWAPASPPVSGQTLSALGSGQR